MKLERHLARTRCPRNCRLLIKGGGKTSREVVRVIGSASSDTVIRERSAVSTARLCARVSRSLPETEVTVSLIDENPTFIRLTHNAVDTGTLPLAVCSCHH